jgi:hypothetical protein
MQPNDPTDGPDPAIARTEKLLSTAKKLFAAFCTEHSVSPRQASGVNICDFFAWLQGLPRLDACAFIDDLGLDYPVREELLELPSNPQLFLQFAVLWDQVTLASRGLPQNPIRCIHSVSLLFWEDGRMTPLSNFVPCELACEAGEFTEGAACTAIRHGGEMVASILAQQGADTLHDQSSYVVTRPAVLELASAMQAAIDAQADPGLRGQMEHLMQIWISYINPPVQDPAAVEMIKKRRAAKEQRKARDPRLLGGGFVP